jgi:hypothetical protein
VRGEVRLREWRLVRFERGAHGTVVHAHDLSARILRDGYHAFEQLRAIDVWSHYHN